MSNPNLFLDLPMPAFNGAGAAVDTSGMGRVKTIICRGDFTGCSIMVEVSNDAEANWAPLVSFHRPGQEKVIEVAAESMRVYVQGRVAGVAFTANVDVSANSVGGLFEVLPLPVGDGAGVPVDVSDLGFFKTAVVRGDFHGTLAIEASNDGVDYAPVWSFQSPGSLGSKRIAANYMRVRASGSRAADTASVSIGAVNDGTISASDQDRIDALSVADLTALAALDTSMLPDGTITYVIAEDNIWALQRASVDVPDGVDVIAAAGGVGNWISQLEGRWDDIVMEPAIGNAVAALTVEAYLDTPLRCGFFRYDQDDSLHFRFQMPHKWDYTQRIRPHIHVVPMGDPLVTEYVRFTGYYAWTRINDLTQPLGNLASGAWTAIPAQLFAVNPGDQYIQQLWSLVGDIVPPAWARESTLFLLYLVRTGTDPGDTYTTVKPTPPGTAAANLCILSSDIHYRAKHFGTITPAPAP